MNQHADLIAAQPRIQAPLDPGFIPAVIARASYRQAVKESGAGVRILIALEREDGCVKRADVDILPADPATDAQTLRYVERHIKTVLWAFGGWKLSLCGPAALCESICRFYTNGGPRSFDAEIMSKAYDRQFTVCCLSEADFPQERELELAIGGHLDGCRVGFDLGASDYKVAAVIDGRPVFSTEIPWIPSIQQDPNYHYTHILEGIRQAASHMPRLDAIGGSSAGIVVNNKVKQASLFRSVPEADFNRVAKPMFLNLQKELGVPLLVINDGDVTALAGAMSLKKNGILGLAMGSSEAAGFLNRNGRILGYLNELAFVPVDFSLQSATEEWSRDIGVGALYFSQQAVNKLAPTAGFTFPVEVMLPERLKHIQEEADKGNQKAQDVFATIGVYLGYTVPLYAEYYDFDNMLILGRVTSGRGGELIIEKARAVLKSEFPQIAERIALHVPDEASRRIGQAVAAASLPMLH